MEYIKLRNGIEMPCMGYGCYNAFGDEIARGVLRAVEVGYRYIDSAAKYGNEDAVGKALGTLGDFRSDLFILSKCWPSDYENVEAAAMKTMKDLQVEYLDAYLLHWPGIDENRRLKAYEQLLRLQEKGICRIAATSNFLPDQLEVLNREFGAYPVLNELELHPSHQQKPWRNFCVDHGIQTIAYSPINRSKDLTYPAILQMAEKYGKTPGQVVLRWHIQKGQLPIPKSSDYDRVLQNISIFDFELTADELEQIDALDCGARSGLDPYSFNG